MSLNDQENSRWLIISDSLQRLSLFLENVMCSKTLDVAYRTKRE